MKKTLALVLALAMVFSTITVAFAEDTIGAEAQNCKDLGMLIGEGNGVDADYLAKTPTRIQSAIMFLRLKGLYEEAIAFTGEANFADGNIPWTEGRNLLAYLKANPQLGWQGDGTNFYPNNPITAQEYYKVLLEALGYKQSTAEVVGDFAYADVITFAASKGLTKVATVTNYTVNDLAIATVEALKADMKEGGKTLIATLVEAGKVDKAKAIEAGLYADATATTAELKAAKAIGNTAVEVEYTEAVDKAFAENIANYAIVEKGTTTALAVSAAVLDGTKKVVLTTAAQTSGKAYTLTVGTVEKNFGGIAKDTGAPEIDTVKGTDTERVEVAFTKIMDLATALDVNTYKIEGITIEKAAWADSTRKVVELTTKGLVANKSYKVTVANVKSVDGIVLKSASKSFMAKSDKTAPKVAKIITTGKGASTNTRIIVVFDQEVTEESAQDLANYKLTVGSSDANTLEITAAKLVEDIEDWNGDDDDADMSVVELTTVSQKAGQKYVLHVNNIVDTSVLANKMTKEQKINYYGKKVDETKPTAVKMEYITNQIIDVTFSDESRLDATTALDAANYVMNNDIAVQKVEWKNPDDPNGKVVRLTVDQLGEKGSYSLVINNVADEYGNVIKEKKFTQTFNESNVNIPATISYAKATGKNTIKVTFTKEVDAASAKDPANYSINNGIGTPVKVSYDSDTLTTTLTVNDLKANTEYKITVNGVKDLAGNVITNVAARAVRVTGENDITAPEIQSIEAVNNKVVRITFDEPIAVSAASNTPTIGIDTNGDDAVEINGQYAVSTDDDDMVLEFTLDTPFSVDADVELITSTVRDLAGNKLVVDAGDNAELFPATTEEPELVELSSWEQVSVKKFKLQFSEKINDAIDGSTITDTSSTVVPYALTVKVDPDDATIVYLKSNVVMDPDKTFQIDLSGAGFANYHGVPVAEDEDTNLTEMVTSLEDDEDPFIESVEADSSTTITITFNEDMATPGDYKITYEDEDGKTQTIAKEYVDTEVDGDDNTLVNLTLTGGKKLYGKYSYTLHVESAAKDVAHNSLDTDATFDFAGTDVVAISQYVSGVKVYNGTKFKVITFSSVNPSGKVVELVYGASATPVTLAGTPAGTPVETATGRSFTVNIATYVGADLNGDGDTDDTVGGIVEATYEVPVTVLADGRTYTAKFDGKSYSFSGIVTDDVTFESDGTYYAFSYEDMAEGDVVVLLDTDSVEVGTVVDANLNAKIAKTSVATTDNVVDILVIRDGVVLFYADNVDLDE